MIRKAFSTIYVNFLEIKPKSLGVPRTTKFMRSFKLSFREYLDNHFFVTTKTRKLQSLIRQEFKRVEY